jgi:glutathione S-transferase
MLRLYHAPRTRSVRVRWLLEELGVPYELESVAFVPPEQGFFSQSTPLGKLPVIEDDGNTICESGAILEYILERYGEGRLAPPIDSPQRADFLQWMHFAEGTLAQPLSTLIWHILYKRDAESVPDVLEDARARAHRSLSFLEEQLGGRDHLLGDEFSAADVMVGFTLASARVLGVLDEHRGLVSYLQRLEGRPAFQKAVHG